MSEPARGEKRTVVVAGATGYLGKHVVRALHRDGWRVRALARDPARLAEARDACDEVFVGEATKPETLAGLFDGAHAAFSSIGIRHVHRHPTYEEVDYGANMYLVDGAVAAGVKRFAFVSVLHGDELRARSPLVNARERVVDRLRESGMETVILRPTGFFNDMGDIFRMAQKGTCWLIGSGDTKINPIHGADLADVAASALAAAEPAAEIPAGGPDVLSQRDIAELAFRVLDRRVKCRRIGPGVIRFLAHLARPFNKNASALALMFSMLGERDGVAPSYGTEHLETFFQHLAAEAAK